MVGSGSKIEYIMLWSCAKNSAGRIVKRSSKEPHIQENAASSLPRKLQVRTDRGPPRRILNLILQIIWMTHQRIYFTNSPFETISLKLLNRYNTLLVFPMKWRKPSLTTSLVFFKVTCSECRLLRCVPHSTLQLTGLHLKETKWIKTSKCIAPSCVPK